MAPQKQYGFYVVNSDNVFEVLEGLGVRPWPRVTEPVGLDEYLKRDLSESERNDLRFAPKTEVVFLRQPDGKPFTGFRNVGKNWSTVFTILPGDLVPIIGEFKHGEEFISLAPPSGVPNKVEMQINDTLERMTSVGKREYEEETGMKLAEIVSLDAMGLSVSGRQDKQRYFPFLGKVAEPIEPGASKLDKTEFLKMVLVPVGELLKLIEEKNRILEDCLVSATFLALRKLGRLKST
jgi:hypothetical protein